MKTTTTRVRRKLVEAILAPQLHTLYHRRTGKHLRLVAIPGSDRGALLREMYAEAFLDLLDSNNLIVVRKPDIEATYPEGADLEVDLDDTDLAEPQAAPPQYRQFKRMKPGDDITDAMAPTLGNDRDRPGAVVPTADNLADAAPSLLADGPPDDDPAAMLGRGAAGMRPTDEAREAFEQLGARMKAHELIKTIITPLLRRTNCAVIVVDNADSRPDRQPSKVTLHIDLPQDKK